MASIPVGPERPDPVIGEWTISTRPLQHHRSPFQSIQPILEHQRLPSAVSDTLSSTSIRRHLVCIGMVTPRAYIRFIMIAF
ncbi:hypothetical protein CEXT_413581 [Caerostris extrusa]|uniref:Uncharacterized protein n=1 Tax=Caerostris extrusa TaxID=172846 RepID=A0AAV4NUP3_CAEEX|nr:hypothetical protein CEXT_413581 [Caerostris extrusa]